MQSQQLSCPRADVYRPGVLLPPATSGSSSRPGVVARDSSSSRSYSSYTGPGQSYGEPEIVPRLASLAEQSTTRAAGAVWGGSSSTCLNERHQMVRAYFPSSLAVDDFIARSVVCTVRRHAGAHTCRTSYALHLEVCLHVCMGTHTLLSLCITAPLRH